MLKSQINICFTFLLLIVKNFRFTSSPLFMNLYMSVKIHFIMILLENFFRRYSTLIFDLCLDSVVIIEELGDASSLCFHSFHSCLHRCVPCEYLNFDGRSCRYFVHQSSCPFRALVAIDVNSFVLITLTSCLHYDSFHQNSHPVKSYWLI